jgi:hypothetical protein
LSLRHSRESDFKGASGFSILNQSSVHRSEWSGSSKQEIMENTGIEPSFQGLPEAKKVGYRAN